MRCSTKYHCPMTNLYVRSGLKNAVEECALGADDDYHVVELLNFGSGLYDLTARGVCDEPLTYPDSDDDRSWIEGDVRMRPQLKSQPLVLETKIRVGAAEQTARTTPTVGAELRLQRRIGRGGQEHPLDRRVPPDDSLAFICQLN